MHSDFSDQAYFVCEEALGDTFLQEITIEIRHMTSSSFSSFDSQKISGCVNIFLVSLRYIASLKNRHHDLTIWKDRISLSRQMYSSQLFIFSIMMICLYLRYFLKLKKC